MESNRPSISLDLDCVWGGGIVTSVVSVFEEETKDTGAKIYMER